MRSSSERHFSRTSVRSVRPPQSPDFLCKPAPRLRRRGVDLLSSELVMRCRQVRWRDVQAVNGWSVIKTLLAQDGTLEFDGRRAAEGLVNEDSFKQVLDLDGWREGMLFDWISRGEPVSGVGLHSHSRRMGGRGSGNAIGTEAGTRHQSLTTRRFGDQQTPGPPGVRSPDGDMPRISPIHQTQRWSL